MIFTTETRLSKDDCQDIIEYAKAYRHNFAEIERFVWHYIVSQKGKYNKSEFNTEVQKRFSVTKRTANSCISDMQGRYNALKELKSVEAVQLEGKIEALTGKIEALAVKVESKSRLAAANSLSEKQLQSYRSQKKSLYFRKQKLQKLKDRLSQLKKNNAEKNYSLGFGGKSFFRAQYLLEKNGYKTHEKWKNDYIRKRDGNIYYLGSRDESYGNQMFQLTPQEDGTYSIKLRKDGKYAASKDDRYLYGKCSFSYLNDELQKLLQDRDRPVSCRIKIRGNKVYLQVMLEIGAKQRPVVTSVHDGAVGLDFNAGHIDLSETDRHGNLVSMKQYRLREHVSGSKANNEMRQAVSEIGRYALSKGKSIVIEDLSFIRRKSKTTKAKTRFGKNYNKMIHSLDYRRFESAIKNMTTRQGIDLIEVNPAYTSKIAEQKYCDIRKIPVHNGAAYVIARRGQGYKDRYIV